MANVLLFKATQYTSKHLLRQNYPVKNCESRDKKSKTKQNLDSARVVYTAFHFIELGRMLG